jgi:hypothetical protein
VNPVEFVESYRTLQAHSHGIDALYDPVMEVPSDSVSIVEHTHYPNAVVQPVVLDRDARRFGERIDEGLVLVSEVGTVLLVSQIKVAVDIVSDTQWHAQEGRHLWMTWREAITTRVIRHIGKPQWDGFFDEDAQHAITPGNVSDSSLLGGAKPHRYELLEAGVALVEDAEGRVAGAHERPSFLHEMAEQVREFDVCCNPEDCCHQAAQFLGVIHARVGHTWIVRPFANDTMNE